jgi:hypothetical protein
MIIEFKEKPTLPWVMPDGKRARRTTDNHFRRKARTYVGRSQISDQALQQRSSINYCTVRQQAADASLRGYSEFSSAKIEELLKLSTAELLPNGVRESGYVEATPRRQALPYIVYPSKAVLVWQKKSTDSTGREDLAGHLWDEQTIEFDLWPENEPPNLPNLG